MASLWVSSTALARFAPGLTTAKRPSSRCWTRRASPSRSGRFAFPPASPKALLMARLTSAAVNVFDLVFGASTLTPSYVLPTVL